MVDEALLEVEHLSVRFGGASGVTVIDDVSFTLRRGETLAIVGESGSGKSLTCLSLMRLLPPGASISGAIRFEGDDLAAMPDAVLRRVRGKRLAMVFQDPQTALNPIMRIGGQMREVLRLHLRLGQREATVRGQELLASVGITDPARRMRQYPHELSGGMRQRVMIALALACSPRLVIADEPTTALDVTIQAQILELFGALKARTSAAILLVTHDLGVVAEVSDTVAVMYAGRIVEIAPVRALFAEPLHPYTAGLLRCMPRGEVRRDADGKRTLLEAIPGTVPELRRLPPGCSFQSRCSHAVAQCAEKPPLIDRGHGRHVRCWLHA